MKLTLPNVLVLLVLPLLLFLTSCATPETGMGPLRTWGSLREVLRDGDVRPRIRLASVVAPGVFGIGAATGLDGEITVADGRVWVSRVRNGRVETEVTPNVDATLFFAARVTQWQQIPVDEDVAPEDFEAFLASRAAAAGLTLDEPFAFQVEGPLRLLKLHVIAGECPVRARMLGVEPKAPPFEKEYREAHGRLVGIHARNAGGKITHHDSSVHVHAILGAEQPYTAHVEATGLAKGAVLRLPRR